MDQYELEMFWQEKYFLLEIELAEAEEEKQKLCKYYTKNHMLQDDMADLAKENVKLQAEIKLRSKSEKLGVGGFGKLQAENKRLRKALKKIMKATNDRDCDDCDIVYSIASHAYYPLKESK